MSQRIIDILKRMPGEGQTAREAIYDCEHHEIHLWRVIPGEWIYPHRHPATDDIWYLVQGQGEYYLSAEEKRQVGAGTLLLASAQAVHGVFNSGQEDMLILSVLAPLPVEYDEAPGFNYPLD